MNFTLTILNVRTRWNNPIWCDLEMKRKEKKQEQNKRLKITIMILKPNFDTKPMQTWKG